MKTRKLKDDTEATELDFPIILEVKTKVPEKWLLIDLETGEHYRGSNSVEQYNQWIRQGDAMPDIDIDFLDRTHALEKLKHVGASIEENGTFKKHNTGVYCTSIPHNPFTKLSTIDYKQAEERGYFKIDFLNVSIYKGVRDEAHLKHLMETEPIWDLLLEDDFTEKLFHVSGHGAILREMKPQSVEQLAAVLAVIRPAKRYLIGKDWNTVMSEVWLRPEGDEYFFKKAHAVAYAAAIVVQMNLICEQLSASTD